MCNILFSYWVCGNFFINYIFFTLGKNVVLIKHWLPLWDTTVYAKTYNLIPKWKWCATTYDCAHTHRYYVRTRNNVVYVRISIRVPRPTQDRIDFSRFSKARFSKRLERFCSTLLLHTATMVETSRIPRFSFWNGCYRFAPNSKFHSASKDRETGERVELSQRKYSRRRVCS